MTLVEALERAGSLARRDACAIFLEVLQLAVEAGSLPDATRLLVGEDGGIVSLTDPAPATARQPIEQLRAASALAAALFQATGGEPPFGLGPDRPGSTDRFPTLRHLLDAFELQLLISRAPDAPPPPTQLDARMAIAALVAKAQKIPSPAAATVEPPISAAEEAASPPAAALRAGRARWAGLAVAAIAGAAIAVLVQRNLARPVAPPAAVQRPPDTAIASAVPAPAVEEAPRPASDPALLAPFRPASDARHRPVRRLRSPASTADRAHLDRARNRLQLGEEALKDGRVFQALVAFRQALEDDPDLLAALRGLGDAYRLHQDEALALDAYQRYLESDPSAPDADEVRTAVDELRAGAQ